MKYRIPTYTVRLVRERAVIKCGSPEQAGVILTELCTRDDQSKEVMWCLHLNNQNKITGGECVAKGGGYRLSVSVSDILRGAIVAGAQAIILGHNHPSENSAPSSEDFAMTKTVKEGCAIVGIRFADSIIVTVHNGYYSMMAMGDLK